MFQLQNVKKFFADRAVLNGIDWTIGVQDRIGLCGENGAGKTTLLRLLAGQVAPDDGQVQSGRDTTLGYLPQDGLEFRDRTLFAEVRGALAELLSLEQELKHLESALGSADTEERTLERYAQVQELFLQRGGYAMEAEIGKVLHGLGFAESDWQRPCEEFSGGWQMRIGLAKLLLRRPNLLLLDEPTNHLDLPARDWLEDYLVSYPFAVVLVSHDRFFLDRVVTRIVEVWNGRLTEYPGNYSHYLEAREARILALREARRRQDEEIARIEAFINRFRYQANKAALVQSRVKQLEKIERVDVPPARKKIAFRFPEPPKGGRLALELEGVSHGYGDLQVLREVDLMVERGERIALVGPNGAGKSTLMRILSGVEPPRQGRRAEGHNLRLGYFAQDQARVLDAGRTVIEEITAAAPFEMVPKVRDVLGAFLFSGDDVHKRVAVLSGGERNRLALAILLLRPANLLLLDEPTNHLDLQSKEVLLDALRHYSGTLVFVSHDRYFVDALATRVVEVGGGRLESHPGNYEDFLRIREKAGDLTHSRERVEQHQGRRDSPVEPQREGRLQAHLERKEAKRQERRRQKDLDEVQALIEDCEAQVADLEARMAAPDFFVDAARARTATAEHERLQSELARLYLRWEELELEAAG
ncbi:ABC-F family ATP-binding cassette domain-containing protein [Geoalkalibacter halelectricus]|uniref:ABC-F family ATP-binding cassette domain-containing protein n=1 Tax=Geoalkalibacter halelectricus TaxID=2847045 RepID=UPI003D1AACC5